MLNNFSSPSHFIFGIGNSFANDDRIGLFIIDEFSKKSKNKPYLIKKIDSDLFEIIPELDAIPDSKPILIVDAIITDKLSIGSVIVFNFNQNPYSEIKFGSLSHSLSVIDILSMNNATTKKNLSITFLGIVIENTDYGEKINDLILKKKKFILDLISKFCSNVDITGIYS